MCSLIFNYLGGNMSLDKHESIPTTNKSLRHASEIGFGVKLISYLLVFLGYFFYCYNFVVIDYLRPFLLKQMTLDQSAYLYTFQAIGSVIGSFGSARLVVNFGQKKTLILIGLIIGFGSLANIFVSGFVPWIILRFIIGLALGGYFVCAASLLVKLFDEKYRGRLESLNAATFALALFIMGSLGSTLGSISWTLLLWVGAIPPIVIAIVKFFVLPSDRNIIGYGEEKDLSSKSSLETVKPRVIDIFRKKYIKLTISCIVLSGLNLAAYQFFAAYLTTYLKTAGEISLSAIGMVVMAQGMGSFVGGLFWGVIADKFGRKYPLIGFIIAGLSVFAFFMIPPVTAIMMLVVGIYGFTVSCTYPWGVYFAELYPPHLRPMGAALYNGGRLISFFTPFVIVFMISHSGLKTSMLLAGVILILAGLLWSRLPETRHKNK